MADDRPHKERRSSDQFGQEVGRRAERKLRARREEEKPVWFWLGMFGMVGWSVAVPTVLGAMLGVWLDRRFPGGINWTLNLLIVGVIIGCLQAWFWIKQEGHRHE